MTPANLLAVRCDEAEQKIYFDFEFSPATKEVLGRSKKEVVLSVKTPYHPNTGAVVTLSRLLLPEEDLKRMSDQDFITHAKNTSQVFQKGMTHEWFKKLLAVSLNVEARTSYESQRQYWRDFNRFLGLIDKQYHGGPKDWLTDYSERAKTDS